MCLLLLAAVNAATLHDGHNWGDDFGQYILHARNIAEHRDYAEGIMLDNPIVFPPGYPFLLSLLIKTFGVSLYHFKLLNVVLWYFFVLLLYRIFLKALGPEMSLAGALIFGASSYFFVFKQNVISDVPFLFFTLLSVAAFMEYAGARDIGAPRARQALLWLLFAVGAAAAMWTRSAGASLFLAAVLYHGVMDKSWGKAVAAAGVLIAAWGFQTLWVGSHPGYFPVFFEQWPAAVTFILQNYSLVFSSIAWFFVPPQTPLTAGVFSAMDAWAVFFAGGIILAVNGVFAGRLLRRRVSFYECFCFFYFWNLVAWTAFTNSPQTFSRYVLPLAGYVIITFAGFFHWLEDKVRRWRLRLSPRHICLAAFLGVIACNLFNLPSLFTRNDDVLYKEKNREMFRWVRAHVAPDERYVFWKPRVLALMTGRVGTMLWTRPGQHDRWRKRLADLNISYLILDKAVDGPLIRDLKRERGFALPVWENAAYEIFYLLRDRGVE